MAAFHAWKLKRTSTKPLALTRLRLAFGGGGPLNRAENFWLRWHASDAH